MKSGGPTGGGDISRLGEISQGEVRCNIKDNSRGEPALQVGESSYR